MVIFRLSYVRVCTAREPERIMCNIVNMRLYYSIFLKLTLKPVLVCVCIRYFISCSIQISLRCLFHFHSPFITFTKLSIKPALQTINNGYANPFRVVYACIMDILAWLLCHHILSPSPSLSLLISSRHSYPMLGCLCLFRFTEYTSIHCVYVRIWFYCDFFYIFSIKWR